MSEQKETAETNSSKNESTSSQEAMGNVAKFRRRILSLSIPPTPWFGLDIGGTLAKLVYFEPKDQCNVNEEETDRNERIQWYLFSKKAYGNVGTRDEQLQLNDVEINGRIGTIHFIRFPSDYMNDFVNIVNKQGFTRFISTVCATGGGAVKYSDLAENVLGIEFHKADELDSLIKGIEFVAANNPDECYYFENPLDDENCCKITWRWSSGRCSTSNAPGDSDKQDGLQYPYIVCNIGSGVSVLAVRGRNDFTRVTGSSIGGGFFQGLCAIMCGCDSFEESIELASRGDNRNIDKLIKDIYGCDYSQIGLPADIVAASFGKINCSRDRDKASREDLARSALVTTANNIGSIAFFAATSCKIDRIVFVGNFLRVNRIAARVLSHAMNFWSKGSKKALFLSHEGYLGAVGCLDKLIDVTDMRRRRRIESGNLYE